MEPRWVDERRSSTNVCVVVAASETELAMIQYECVASAAIRSLPSSHAYIRRHSSSPLDQAIYRSPCDARRDRDASRCRDARPQSPVDAALALLCSRPRGAVRLRLGPWKPEGTQA